MAYSLLALGDSYTIGEGVSSDDNFPARAVHLLQDAGQSFRPPEILARTGWTTDELAAAMSAKGWPGRDLREPPYDFVTLLIGVNNQYRGRKVEEYAVQFEQLLKEAIRLGGHVIVLSIPDWSVSPFAQTYLPDDKGRTIADVAAGIDAFNDAAARITGRYEAPFIDITTDGRAAGPDPALFTADGLHPAAGTYRIWAERVAGYISKYCSIHRN